MVNESAGKENRFAVIEKFLALKGEPKYRFGQVLDAIFKEKIDAFKKITTVSKKLRDELASKFKLLSLSPLRRNASGRTVKILFGLEDDERVESVLMRYKNEEREWSSVCVSSQVGCNLGCVFCATGKIGFKRNLTVDEIVDQVLYFHLQSEDIDSVSFMGMGEPLLNPAVFEAIEVLTDKRLFGFSQRKINVSTVGIIPGIERLTKDFSQINIAFSLHTPFEDQRQGLMPVSRQYSIKEVMAVLNECARLNKRKIFLPYMMLAGVNDTKEHLDGLIKLIKERKSLAYLYHVNLIRYNPAQYVGDKFKCSPGEAIEWFEKGLEKAGINVTLRRSFGESIHAACGQLYAEY